MGSLDFISPEANLATALVFKDPSAMLLDVEEILPQTGAAAFFQSLNDILGLDLRAMSWIEVEAARDALWAADCVMRTPTFALVVVAVHETRGVDDAALARLAGLARRHHLALVFLTPTNLGLEGAISLRARVRRRPGARLELRILKDRRGLRGPLTPEPCHDAMGLCLHPRARAAMVGGA